MISEDAVAEALIACLHKLGVRSAVDRTKPILRDTDLHEEDWHFDFIPWVEETFDLPLDDLLLTGEVRPPHWFARLFGGIGTPMARDVSVDELARFIYARRCGG